MRQPINSLQRLGSRVAAARWARRCASEGLALAVSTPVSTSAHSSAAASVAPSTTLAFRLVAGSRTRQGPGRAEQRRWRDYKYRRQDIVGMSEQAGARAVTC